MISGHPAGLGGAAEAHCQPSQPYPLTAAQHGALLHARSPGSVVGHVAVATKSPGEGWREKVYPASELLEMLPRYVGRSDVFISTQRFWAWRRITRLAQCEALAVDVDFYKVERLRDSHPLGVLEDCRVALERARMPQPSLAIASGRGLYLFWLHEPVPRQALPRWNACQLALWEVLKPLGADRSALDAARMLRLVETHNSSTGVIVEALTPASQSEVWAFDDLADEVLPYTRAEIVDLRIQRAARAARRPARRRQAPPQRLTIGNLWEARLTDLQTLRRIRWSGEPMDDFRDRWLFLAGVAMSWLVDPAFLQRELYALAHEVGGWTEVHTHSRMHAVFRTAREAAEGHTVEWEGRQFSPLYRFRNETIIEWLEITREEQREMRTLISAAEKQRRRAEKARQAGVMSRKEYKDRAAWRRAEARRMHAESVPLSEIAAALGVSCHTVRSYVFR
jgi:hypothetical protein